MHHDYENGNTQDHVDYHKNILEYIYFFVFFSTSAAHFPENNYNHRLVSSEPSYVLFFRLIRTGKLVVSVLMHWRW